jgi:hypothetical protein
VATNGGYAVMGLGHSPRIVTDGLVLCLDAANARSYPGTGTTWTDRSGNGNDGTLTNGPTFDSDNGGILSFDGTNENLTIPSVTFNSIELWCYRTQTFSNWHYLFDARGGMSQGWFANGSIGSNWASNMYKNGELVSRAMPPQNEWTHLYIYTNNATSYTDDITFFSRYSNIEYLGVDVSQIKIYNKLLTADEVRQNYEATKGRYE